MPSSKIITVYEHPPIPVRWFDWYAYREGADECDNCGHGSTREVAIVRLKELEAEDDAEFPLLGRTDGGEVDINAGRC